MRTLFVTFLMASMLLGCGQGKEITAVKTSQAKEMEQKGFDGIVVHFLGISEGESTLITFSDGYTVLIDSGSTKSGKEVADLLVQNHIKKLDMLVLTGDMDEHLGGAGEILLQFPVDQVMLPAPMKEAILDKIDAPIRSIVAVEEGQTFNLPEQLTMRILHPGKSLSLSPQANSLVFQLTHGKIKWLFTSDVNADVEQVLLEKYNLKSQILKVSDSGSNQASSPPFLQQVDAHAAIIFKDNDDVVGFDEVIERLNETWIDIFQTKNHGTIRVYSTKEDYKIERGKVKGYFDAE